MSEVGERRLQGAPSMAAWLAVPGGQGSRRLALLGAIAALVAGCGSSGPTFTASEFVDQVNGQGVSMKLGRQLPAASDAKELYAISLPPLPGSPAPPPGEEGGPGASGSLYVYDDTGGAQDELRACRASAGLVCFQAANVVVVLNGESGGIEARRLAVAIQRLRAK
jgi:hypothetical protein